MSATRRWQAQLEAWRIPESILATAEDSPWVLPRHLFTRRADMLAGHPEGASFPAAWQALEKPGSVLDVGAGAGAASLPLAARCTTITAVDHDATLLAGFRARARELRVTARTVEGTWPEAAAEAGPADVVVCHHVLYNVPDPAPFVRALTVAARRLVVVELAARHPLTALADLWRHFHGLDRPDGPAAEDALAVLGELGITPAVRRWRRERSASAGHPDFAALVEVTRRRLCLPRERAGEVAEALRSRPVPDTDIVTLTWVP
ncbi:class I SAM-dependent methyltransferase [Prauserella oleivorans]|uniref:Class I SAM-dependent methyltransferase n=1 Tax=Prauserella oleivorans TaxID=1478153 RepID=A0ABW5WAW5_9PSEU